MNRAIYYTSNVGYIAQLIIEELSKTGYSEIEIVDMLVKHLYHKTKSKSKESLWFCYGGVIFENLQKNIGDKKSICLKCGKRFEKNHPKQEYCENCGHEYVMVGKKLLLCVDCEKEFYVDGIVKNKCRCNMCQSIINKEKRRIWKRNHDLKCN